MLPDRKVFAHPVLFKDGTNIIHIDGRDTCLGNKAIGDTTLEGSWITFSDVNAYVLQNIKWNGREKAYLRPLGDGQNYEIFYEKSNRPMKSWIVKKTSMMVETAK